MKKESIESIMIDIGLEPISHDENTRLPKPDQESLNRIMVDIGLESIKDSESLPQTEILRSSK